MIKLFLNLNKICYSKNKISDNRGFQNYFMQNEEKILIRVPVLTVLASIRLRAVRTVSGSLDKKGGKCAIFY
jgi:hypothetical protein